MSSRSRKMRWLIPVGATSALLVLGYSRGRDYGVHTPVKGKTIAVKRDRMVRSIVAVGKIEPLSKVELKSKASGIIKALTVDIGDRVRAGQMLAELDKDNLSARVREAKAALAVAVANHQSALAEREKRKIESEQPELELARRNYSRASELFGEKLISRAALDESRTGLESATARQAAARASLAVSNAQIVAAEAAVGQATAVLERCEEELRNATLTSPIDGVVLARNVEIGSPVSSILQLGAVIGDN